MERDAGPEALRALVDETRRIWDLKAPAWDARMGEGNAFHRVLVGPAAERLLGALPRLLTPAGRFVFTLPHPAFSYPGGTRRRPTTTSTGP